MIHDELLRHFRARPRPSLSADFEASLRGRLRSAARPKLGASLAPWVPRLYWLGAAVLIAAYWRPVSLTPFQVAALAAAAAVTVQTLRRALHVGPLPRVLRMALWR